MTFREDTLGRVVSPQASMIHPPSGHPIACRFPFATIALVFATSGLFTACGPRRVLHRDFISSVAWFPDGDNVLANGSFECGTTSGNGRPECPDTNVVFQPNAQGFMSLPKDSTTIPGWRVIGQAGQDVAWLVDPNAFKVSARDGQHFLDLTGGFDTADAQGQFAGVQQSFTTAAQKGYWLMFEIGIKHSLTSPQSSDPDFPGPIQVDASLFDGDAQKIGPLLATTSCSFDSMAKGTQWSPFLKCYEFFVALSTKTTVKISATKIGANAQHYIGLDAVSVECLGPLGQKGFCK